MSDFEKLINASDLIEWIIETDPDWCVGSVRSIIDHIDKMPSPEPERKKGKWIVTSEFDDCCYAKCNQCNVTQIFYYGKPLTNYCPDCGSYNGGEQE